MLKASQENQMSIVSLNTSNKTRFLQKILHGSKFSALGTSRN